MNEQQYIVLGFCCLLIAILTGIYETTDNILSVQGGELQSLTNQITEMKRENLILEDDILYERSFTTISQKAREEGFGPATYYYIGLSH